MKVINSKVLKPDLHFLLKVMPFLYVYIALTVSACSGQSKNKSVPKGEAYLSFTVNGAWCWFSDPRAIYFKGKHRRTYAGWVDSSGNIIVGFYDHELKRTEIKVLHRNFEKDDHDNPSLFIDRQGKLMVFYSKHATPEPIYLVRSKKAEDISEWETAATLNLNDSIAYPKLSDTYTYTNICQLANEKDKLYLFWRGADFKPNFSVSHDSGKVWSAGKILILPDRIYKDRRPYLKVASNNKDAIHFAFTDGHPNVELTNSIYYVKYRGNAFHKANGEKIAGWSALPIQPSLTDMVYDATKTNEKAWIWDVAENKEGEPVIVYSRYPDDSSHVYYYSVWNNNQWNNYKLVNSGPWFPQTPEGKKEGEPFYSGGIVLDHEDPAIVYLSRLKNKKFEIEKWTTPNKGIDWRVEEITSNSENNNVRPFVIRDYSAQDSLRMLWMNAEKYIHYTDYQTSIKMNIR
ncbi:MAG: BNR-4 repeat-containing protein [Flavisolibacter sp.]